MNTNKLLEFVQAIVQLPSLSGEEKAVAERVKGEMESLAFDQVSVDVNGSVIGVIEGERPGKTLLFDAHIDTVGIAPGVPWQHDPFGATIVNDAIVGRGSADMKGALAGMVHAAASVDRATIHGKIVVSASTMEEVLEGVCLQTVMESIQPDFVVVGESTGLNLALGGRGRAEIHLETVGQPAHSSSPQLGRNAVLDMMQVVQAIEDIDLPEHPIMGPAIMALTDIISEPYPGHSVIPSLCRVTYDRRLLPGETKKGVVDDVRRLVGVQDVQLKATIAVGEHSAYTGNLLQADKFFPAWIYDEDDPFVRTSLAGLKAAGLDPDTRAYRFCTNAAYSAGVAGVPTVGFGPAEEGDAHVINEQLKIDELIGATRGYMGIIEAVLR